MTPTAAMAAAAPLPRPALAAYGVLAIPLAMAALPLTARNVRLHLHPEDATLVRETLSVSDNERSWKIVDDPVLTRGGCKVSSDTSQIDASVERRLHNVIANVLGGQRETDGE